MNTLTRMPQSKPPIEAQIVAICDTYPASLKRTASAAPGASSCAALGWDGTLAPNNAGANTLVSSGNSLTFTFCRDSSMNFAGWAARVEVYVPPPPASVPALNDPAIAALALLLALGALAALRRRGSG